MRTHSILILLAAASAAEQLPLGAGTSLRPASGDTTHSGGTIGNNAGARPPEIEMASGGANDAVTVFSETLTSLISGSDQHGTFLHLLQRAKLIPMLSRMNGTVFAPTNAAWKQWEDAHKPAPNDSLAGENVRAFGWLGPGGLAEWLLPEFDAESALSARLAAASSGEERNEMEIEADNQNWAMRQHLLYHILNYTITADDWARENVTTETTLLFPQFEMPKLPPVPDPGTPWTPGRANGLLGTHGQRLRVARPGTEPTGCVAGKNGQKKRGCVGFDHEGARGARVWDGSGWNNTDGDGTHHVMSDPDTDKDKDGKDGDKDKEPVPEPQLPTGIRWGRNGAVVGLDSVMEPPKNMIETLKSIPRLSYLAKLLDSLNPLPAPLPAWIDRAPHVTLFAGSDAAFDSTFDGIEKGYLEGMYGSEGLGRILGPAIVLTLEGQVGWSDMWKKKPTLVPSASDTPLEVTATDAGLTVNGTAVEMVDIFTSNGVIHVLPSLLLPEGFELLNSAEKVLLSRNATRFVSLMRTANLSAEYIGEPGKKNKNKWTILAPIDSAIEYVDDWAGMEPVIPLPTIEDGPASWFSTLAPKAPPEAPLSALLRYHVAPGLLAPSDLEDGSLLATELRTPDLGGERQRLHVEVSDRMQARPEWEVEDGVIRFGGAMVLGTPVKSGQTIIYFISALLQPPLDVLQTAVADLQLSTYVAAVYAAGLEKVFNNNVGTTFFVPRNKAFGQLGLAMKYLLLPEARDELRRMLRYLAVEKLVYTPEVEDGKTVLTTMHGGNIVLQRGENSSFSLLSPSKWAGRDSGASLPANGDLHPARMTAHNALAETGVIHIIDNVVLPADMDMTPGKLMKGSKQRTMAELMVKAGLGWILDGREPTRAEVERVGLTRTVRPAPQEDDTSPSPSPDPNEFALPAYTVLMPTDKAFSHVNLTHYLSDDTALLALLKLHIIPSNLGAKLPKASLEHSPRRPPHEGLPLALEDDVVYPTLLAPEARYGELAFRAWGAGENEWFVGVHNARSGSSDRGGRTSAAGRASVRWKKTKPKPEPEEPKELLRRTRKGDDPDDAEGLWRGGMTLGGGVIVIDTVLIPYDPGWYERWGFLVLTVLGITSGVGLLGISTWWWYITTRRKREGYERVAAEEEQQQNEREQEHANRQWRRMSRSEAGRPNVGLPGPGGANGNGSHPAFDDDDD